MTKRNWTIALDGELHHVDIEHALWLGPCRVRADGKIVAGGTELRATGLSYAFGIGSHNCVAHASSTGAVWTYILAVDGNLFPADGEHISRRVFAAKMKILSDWHVLGRLLGLKYLPVSTLWPSGQHRLVGGIEGFPVSIRPVAGLLRRYESVKFDIRTAPVPGGRRFYEQLASAPNFTALVGGEPFRLVSGAETMLEVNSPFFVRGENPIVVANSIRLFLAWLSARVRPPFQNACELDSGVGAHAAPARLILMNGWLRVMCDECIRNEPARRRANPEKDVFSLSRVAQMVFRGIPMAGVLALLASFLLTPRNAGLASVVLVTLLLSMRSATTRDAISRSSLNDDIAVGVLGVLVVVAATPIQGIWVAARGRLPESLEAAGQIAAIAWAGLGPRAASMGVYLAVVGLVVLALMTYRLLWTRFERRDVLNPSVEEVGPWPWPSELGRATRADGPG